MGRITYQEMEAYWPTATNVYAATVARLAIAREYGFASWARLKRLSRSQY